MSINRPPINSGIVGNEIPVQADPIDVVTDLDELAATVEGNTVYRVFTDRATRDAMWPAPPNGARCSTQADDMRWFFDGAWIPLGWPDNAGSTTAFGWEFDPATGNWMVTSNGGEITSGWPAPWTGTTRWRQSRGIVSCTGRGGRGTGFTGETFIISNVPATFDPPANEKWPTGVWVVFQGATVHQSMSLIIAADGALRLDSLVNDCKFMQFSFVYDVVENRTPNPNQRLSIRMKRGIPYTDTV